MKVESVKFFTNGNVMAFDEEGEQIPELQGFLFNVISKLKEECDEKTDFGFNEWKGREMECDFKWWFENNNKEQDLKEAIENRTEDPEDIDVDASDVEVEAGQKELRKDLIKICKNLELAYNEPIGISGAIRIDGEHYKYHFEFFKDSLGD